MSHTLPRLTSLSTQTLTLILERQRLQSLAGSELSVSLPSSSFAQITRNLTQLRTGIYALEGQNGNADGAKALRSQYDRMRDMLGVDKDRVEALEPQDTGTSKEEYSAKVDPIATPYKDDPDAAQPYADVDPDEPFNSADVLESQRLMMHGKSPQQDTRLDTLHSSLTRQHTISQELSSELDAQAGLLTELDTDLDRTSSRLGRARRTLDKFGRGIGANGSTVAIGVVILVLLILIVVFKT